MAEELAVALLRRDAADCFTPAAFIALLCQIVSQFGERSSDPGSLFDLPTTLWVAIMPDYKIAPVTQPLELDAAEWRTDAPHAVARPAIEKTEDIERERVR